ncbi:ABC transporter ATP-binding protein [Stenomitos frigidus]|uniref:Heme ABC transporter ATP-binding protein n=1 Tax=Stenomitos frigidus ULC18 TaxID=2107698 RepID=A0A2T1E2M3_9CYAN|nr:ABC transporter ATP-binding protein [Stenomitos frigidus]PSB27002.1 heme ABC transporter ATP-binding protein [Stenomitos frigidus ULC18]
MHLSPLTPYPSPPYLRLEGITKQFGSFTANDNIDLEIQTGGIHALLGENGAGKTTLMHILSGLYRPDAGQIYLSGQPVTITSPNVAIQQGIGMIHQHFMLVPQLTVAENIMLGTGGALRLNLRQKAQEIAAMSEAYGLAVDPFARVSDLPVGTQQRVEILKALYRQAKLLILDEPTAVLTPPEIKTFFDVLRQLAAKQHTIIFISHKLEEVLSLCDAVTVLRRGKVVGTTPTQGTTRQDLAQLMVGREVLFHLDKGADRAAQKATGAIAPVVLAVQNLHVSDDRALAALKGVSFQLRAGEILGVAGVDGNGQRELADAIAGLRCATQGTILLNDTDITQWTPQQRVKRLKFGYIPEDRQKMGLVMPFSIARNLILKAFQRVPFCRRWLLQRSVIDAHASDAIQAFDIRATSGKLRVSQLSGGNQQKVVLARELSGEPALIMAMQPTRGLDVGATEYVQKALLAERARGAAILYISTELEEVMAMSDRIAVLYEGQFLAVLEAETATVTKLGLLMAGDRLS